MTHYAAPGNPRPQLLVSLQLWRIRKNFSLLRIIVVGRQAHPSLQLAAASALLLLIYIRLSSAQLLINACGHSARWHRAVAPAEAPDALRHECTLKINNCWLPLTLLKLLVWAHSKVVTITSQVQIIWFIYFFLHSILWTGQTVVTSWANVASQPPKKPVPKEKTNDSNNKQVNDIFNSSSYLTYENKTETGAAVDLYPGGC